MTSDLCIQNGVILNPSTGKSRRADIRIRDGLIVEIGSNLTVSDERVLDAKGRMISPGWMDMHVHLRDPGEEHKETITTGCRAAAFGGFTAVACMPNTNPPIDNREAVHSLIKRAEELPVDVHPIACVSRGRQGKDLSEMAELAATGAVAFSDDGSPVQNGSLMRRALEYTRVVGKPIINHMEDLSLGPKGQMNEGIISTNLGLTPIPTFSEESMLGRDLMLAELTQGHLHVAHVSTARSTAMIREAKARGIHVTAEACTHHFSLTDEMVEESGFDVQTKMHPPLRTAEDVEAIRAGLCDGTLDAICTDHAPHAAFEKETDFVSSPFGIIGLETAWGLTGQHLIATKRLSVAEAVNRLCVTPREILGLNVPAIEAGAKANLTIFDATTNWVFESRHIHSKSRNTPFVGSPMTGRAWAIYNKGQLVEHQP
ncbi:MAG: dihydroorotase [Rhodothermaceae bacterium]|nr:dihydroorotase [Rhodothermaceae bacterium]MXZ58658.1 dihydroorotase [Rhodothermaceae bacterium]MYB90980.1 dihydroorotase [Rhodothermaceae bacterium]MYD66971.1 dihydroorotase [Rhodothermaceae bacterium]MYG44775.1 dihydroorotase [Rhodothermaceae bacterium]